MTVLIATSFTKSLDKLTGQEQTAVKVTAFDIQQNPDSPGLSLHRIDRCQDPDFWSARVNKDIRIVLHKRAGNTVLAYVDHHDDAYTWAQRRRLDEHPTTGAAQIVEIRETVEEVIIRRYVEEAVRKPPIFAGVADQTLLSWGVPEDWLDTVRQATEDTVLDIAGHLPDEAQEALLAAAVGEAPTVRLATRNEIGYSHPDARRRFMIVGDEAELAAALDAPWDEWAIFLHPAQREFVDRNFNGPARVIGSAGTGKTVVALHRAVRLAGENTDHRVLLTTFSTALVEGLANKVERLTRNHPEVASRLTVSTLPDVARRLARERLGEANIASDSEVAAGLVDAAAAEGTDIASSFLSDEWRMIVDAWDVRDADTYRELPRLGRKVRMAASRRDELWRIFARVREALVAQSKETEAGLMHRLAREMRDAPYTHVVVDEAQDISVPELYLIASMVGDRPNGLFFAGDIGQRIFRSAFPWKAAGVDIQGRSRSLKVNYRTSHQIRSKSDVLLPARLLEADGGEDNRSGVSSVFHGPTPEFRLFDAPEEEIAAVGGWVDARLGEGILPETIAVLVRSEAELPRAQAAVAASSDKNIRAMLMHDAKGREFRAVAVIACDLDVLPSESRLVEAADERMLKEIYDTERHLLYVAATRAREQLWISASGTPSEFLEDLIE
ncbi:UvrD-helicase domain-containing protein [Rhizobium lentis]|uniref:UvrD-helicase domain-containing protein n=1 Tax=Rhizobium lentis TaxID=1138194 RepID=UPI001C837EC0|nr:UvrD-helicase domain-containing protein [Rhizobium lentis]MBX4954746.1 UvrD-helicase domain-containing protein [Rhizobium lentis]MBX5034535.1 UvrD-helicase domain-containing protein [Rhizobium lentis]